ncbi:MAG: LiaF domain-containing protein, partial [Candidatus Zixiibacteriota bacterium]
MDRRKIIFGLILIAIGVILLGRSLHWIDFSFGDFIRTLIPLGLILLGLWLIVRKKRQEEQFRTHARFTAHATTSGPSSAQPEYQPPETPGPSGSTMSASTDTPRSSTQATVSATAGGPVKFSKFLGDLVVDCNGVNLQNVEVSSGVGDAEIRLHGGRLTAGLNRLIISGFVGDIRIYVPVGMPHFVHCSNFIGDINAGGQKAVGFSNTIESQTPDYDSAEAKLYIAANN